MINPTVAYRGYASEQAEFDAFWETIKDLPPEKREREAWNHCSKKVAERGLLKPRWGIFTCHALIIGLMGLLITYRFLAFNNNCLQVIGLAIGAAFVSTQFALLAHAVGHKQVVRGGWKLRVLQHVFGEGLLAFSFSWWNNKHEAHHNAPNVIGKDPDLEISVAILDERQSLEGKGQFGLFMIKHEYVLPALFVLQGVNARWSSLSYLMKKAPGNQKYIIEDRWIQMIAISIHIALYIAVMVWIGWSGLIFGVVHQAGFGMYNSWIFASNHKFEMKSLPGEAPKGRFSSQVLTSTDVTWGKFKWLISILQGWLDEQIAHHLFRQAPAQNLGEIRRIARPYCERLGLPWHEVTPPQVVKEVFGLTWRMSKWARQQPS